MPSEIAAFIQSQFQTQTPQGTNTSSNNHEDSQPGLFDSFMSEYISGEENTADTNAVVNTNTDNQENTTQLITFKGTNSFSQSVIDILAGFNDNQEFQDISARINDIIGRLKDSGEDIHDDVQGIISRIKSVISEKISALNSELPDDIDGLISRILNDASIPEDTKQEIISAVDDLVKSIRDSELADENIKSLASKISDVIHEHLNTHKGTSSVHDNVEDNDDTEDENADNDNAEVRTASFNVQGASVIPIDSVRSDTVSESSQPEITEQNHSSQQTLQTQLLSNESRPITQKVNMKPQNEHEAESATETETEETKHESNSSNFNEHLEHADNENSTSNHNQNPQEQSQSNNPSGHEENSPEHEQTRRTRNDSRRTSSSGTSSRTQNELTETNSRRTESHNTFQSFFEGVLSSRRNSSRTSSATPLNLQTASYRLNESQTLRDGMTNIIRFIRADGVQKANVVIDPPALGRISVELSSTSSGVEASIKVASEQIRQLVQDQLSELRMNLSQQGVQVAEFTVDVQQDNSGNSNHQSGHYGNEQRAFAISEADDETEEFRIDLEEGLLYWVA
jgi:flagellar hook-length control protein FliK